MKRMMPALTRWLTFQAMLAWGGALTLAAEGADWHTFRGGQELLGVAGGTLSTNLQLLWTYKTPAPIRASAVIDGNRVFIGSTDSNVHCLNLATGKREWASLVGAEVEAPALYLDGRVFVGDMDGSFHALEAATGKKLWGFKTDDKIVGAANWVQSPKSAEKWVLVGSHDFKLYCLDAVSGRSNWVYESGNYINGSPAVSDGRTVFGGCDALLHVIGLADGQKLKEVQAGAYILGSVAVTGGKAYTGHYENAFICADLVKGEIVWTYKDKLFPYSSSPAITADRVVFGGRDKALHCVRRDTGVRLWTFATQGKVDSSPVVCDGKVMVGSDDGRLYLVSLADGRRLWSYDIGQAVSSSPAIAGGRVVIASEDGNVYAFGPPPGRN